MEHLIAKRFSIDFDDFDDEMSLKTFTHSTCLILFYRDDNFLTDMWFNLCNMISGEHFLKCKVNDKIKTSLLDKIPPEITNSDFILVYEDGIFVELYEDILDYGTLINYISIKETKY